MNVPSPIPRIIHQTWKSREISPPFHESWPDSWRLLNPGWEYRFWTDQDLLAFVRAEYPAFFGVFANYDEPIKRVDAARYLILRRFGGVYVDLDFMCLKPMEEFLGNAPLVFGTHRPGSWMTSEDHICNAFMASAPRHPFWEGIEAALAKTSRYPVLDAGGPQFLTRRLQALFEKLKEPDRPRIAAHEALYPVAWDDEARFAIREHGPEELRRLFPEAAAITFWTATWVK